VSDPKKGGDKSKKGQGKANKAPQAAPVKGYEWESFTTKSVEFVAAASRLSDYVTKTYGSSVSITQYEKYLVAYGQMTSEKKVIHTVESDGVNLAIRYQAAKTARASERLSFRGDIQVKDVQGSLETLAASFQTGVENPSQRSLLGEAVGGDVDEDQMGY